MLPATLPLSSQVFGGLLVVACWWLGTSALLLVDRMSARAQQGANLVVGGLGIAGLVGLVWASAGASRFSPLVGFGAAFAVWAFHETLFLQGVVTGPRKVARSAGARGIGRFVEATAAVLHHEVALAATVALVVGMTWGAPEQTGTHALLVLWVMRLSAKFNLFLGVRNVHVDLLPHRTRYLASYFGDARFSPLMPVSVVGGALATAWLFAQDHFGATLVGALLALAVLEHIFLAIPVPDDLLWRWTQRGKSP